MKELGSREESQECLQRHEVGSQMGNIPFFLHFLPNDAGHHPHHRRYV